MLRRIAAVIAKDARTGARDQIVTYMMFGPLLLGLMVALLMPLLEDAPVVFAVSQDLAAEHVAALEAHGAVTVLADRQAVVQRVREHDDVTGVVPGTSAATAPNPAPNPAKNTTDTTAAAAGKVVPEVLLQGDEPAQIARLPGMILDYAERVRRGHLVTAVEFESLGADKTQLRLIATALLGYSVVVLVGLVLGFTILEEKQTGIADAVAISPLRFGEYAAAKLTLGALLSLLLVVPVVVIPLGWDIDFAGLLLVTAASMPFALALGLVIGGFTKDQLGAIAIMKALLPVWTSLPIVGFVVGPDWLWLLSPFANHWGVQAFYDVLRGAEAMRHAGLAVLLGVPVLAASLVLVRRRLGFVVRA